MKSTKILFVILLMFGLISCEKEENPLDPGNCDKSVIIDKELYNKVNAQNYIIQSAKIRGDCLEVQISSGGCDGSSWDIKLIDLGAIAESLPPQRYLKISLESEEACLAIVTRKISFNLVPLQISGDEVILNLENLEEKLNYRY